MTNSINDAVSTLILIGDNEYVLRTSQGRVLFDNYRCLEASLKQEFVLTLDSSHKHRTSSPEDAAVPIILSTPSTSRFELSIDDTTLSSFETMLSLNSPRTFVIKFRPPKVSESDYAWDNFQDQIVIHTRLSKLVIHLEAWKHAFASGHESSLLFPASLPDVKTPPFRLFGAIEQNTGNVNELSKPRTPPIGKLPSISRPPSRNRQSSPSVSPRGNSTIFSFVNAVPVPLPVLTAIQSEREAREVIQKLRRRRSHRSNTEVLVHRSPTSVADTTAFPETLAPDTSTKTDLEKFNNLIVAAKDQIMKENEQAKSELAYYQQLLPKPPLRESPAEIQSTVRRARHKSAPNKRPLKLPSLERPPSTEAVADMNSSVNNQDITLEQVSKPRKSSGNQKGTRNIKLESLSRRPEQQEATKLPVKLNTRKSIFHDFDIPDPEVDDAPIVPDDLSGVAALDADDY
ncbi:hypothetical protein F443_22189 [Phytophthora nicotianae P1569]|uniref:Uncharacterized protein n=1 Tax=Phytophthora nicotianae P1569 TaxID=1317065 RepID=V9DV14_PHYNI|nr:hypothetical protein F443_22189 [Phytophthora nicotianae P1569]